MTCDLVEDLGFSRMEYAANAGLDPSKLCLPGTRESILHIIKVWICGTGEDVPRVLWLSGKAGKGKSAIAHTIVNWFNQHGGLGACFCFDRTRKFHGKIFTTVARDLADCDPVIRRALGDEVHSDSKPGLRHMLGQWHFIIRSIYEVAPAPVLIVMDALNESGEAAFREQILHLLGGRSTVHSQPIELPMNARILVTSRPLDDIYDALHSVSHVHHMSLDDIESTSTEHDIQVFISTKLANQRNVFSGTHFRTLAQRSDGLFEWARLASDYVKKTGLDPMSRFNAVATGTSAKGTDLLDEMYGRILAEIMPEDQCQIAITRFRSVMGQILASSEPLSIAVLTAVRLHFTQEDDRYEVDDVTGLLGSLLTGTADFQTPIRPFHASFYDFLTEKSRSGRFFVDLSLAHSDLAFASLRIMESRLRFNICSLESSYFPNSDVPDLQQRVKESIPTELSYSCRFWGSHVRATSFTPLLGEEVEAFFYGERVVFWLEALALMKCLDASAASLSPITHWFVVSSWVSFFEPIESHG
jgi:hypothetical protein